MLDTEWGKKGLEKFRLLRIYIEGAPMSDAYCDFITKLFGNTGIPQYIVINADGNVTAFENDVGRYLNLPSGSQRPGVQKTFEALLDTAKSKGFSFTLEKGFDPPKETAATPQ